MPNYLQVDTEALQGMALALKKVDREARKEWARATRTSGTSVWRSAISKRTTLSQDKVFGSATVSMSMGGRGVAKVSARPLSGGLGRDARESRIVEFGSRAGDPRIVARYNSGGRVAYAALKPFGSWLGQMMLKTTADLIRDAGNVRGSY